MKAVPMTILDRIVADTRDLVAQAKRKTSTDELRDGAFFGSPTLPLSPALSRSDLAFIAEIKKASPSKGLIRQDFDVRALATAYKHGGAAAISVLTEPLYFQGSLQNLALARQTVDLPLLRKDFIIDPFQLYEARAMGADAVLLIATILEAGALRDLHAEAKSLGLDCLVEVYDVRELEKIDFDQVEILGVNNRDLNTFEVDINRSLEVLREAPKNLVHVSESGLGDAIDLAHLHAEGVDAVLIGETFMRAADPGEALRILRTDSMLYAEGHKRALRLVI